MKSTFFKISMTLASVILFPSVCCSQGDTGQSEAIKETAFKFTDKVTGANVTIFESVLNSTRKAQNKCSEMRFFISPVFHVVPFDKDGQQLYHKIKGEDFTTYQFLLLNYHRNLFVEAADIINRNFLNDCEFKITAPEQQVSIMTHSMITFRIKSPGLEASFIAPLGEIGSPHNLGDHTGIDIKVSKQIDTQFNEFLNSPVGFTIESSVHFNAIDIKMSSKSWSITDIQGTEAYKDLDIKGKEYVSAEQVQQMFRNVARSLKYYELQDPSLDVTISKKASEVFDKFLGQAASQSADDIEAARSIDESLRKGTGLTAEQFKPIEIMRQMTEAVIDETDYMRANEKIRNVCNEQRKSISASAGAGFGPFSASVGYSKSNRDVETNFFKDQDEFNEFKSSHTTQAGGKVVIVERGLKLLDKTFFKNKLALAAEQILVQPVNTAKKWTVTTQSKTIRESFAKYQKELLQVTADLKNARPDLVPVGTIICFAGTLSGMPEETAKRYMVCDGSAIKRDEYPELFTAIKTYWGEGDGHTSFNIPDLRGLFLRGVSDASARDEDKIERTTLARGGSTGNNVGSYQADRVVSHQHPINDPEHSHQSQLGSGWASGGKQIYARHDAGFESKTQTTPSATGITVLENTNGGKETRPENVYVYYLIKVI